MQEILEYGREKLQASQIAMQTQANKYRKEVSYDVGDKVWLSSKNIYTTRPCKDLEDKQLGPYKITEKVGTSYRLALPKSWRIHNVFHTQYLRKHANNPLPGQEIQPPKPKAMPEGDYYDVDDILKSRRYYGRLQYQVKWIGTPRDTEWYYADRDEFKDAEEVVDEYHRRYPKSPR